MSSSPVQPYAVLNEVKYKLNISTSDSSQDDQIAVATNDANNYIYEQITVHSTTGTAAGDDPSLSSMANNLASSYFNFWISTDKDREEIERWQDRIQQYIMAKYGKKSANLLSGEETFGFTSGFSSSSSSSGSGSDCDCSPLTTKGDIFGYNIDDARIPVGIDGYILTADSVSGLGVSWQPVGSGSGNVIGPVSSTDNAVARFDGVTGKIIQNSGVLVDDSDNVTGVTSIAIGDGTWTISESISDELLFSDSNDNVGLSLTEIASAVNYVDIQNNVTTSAPVISSVGVDTSIDLTLAAKGAGEINCTANLDMASNSIKLGTQNTVEIFGDSDITIDTEGIVEYVFSTPDAFVTSTIPQKSIGTFFSWGSGANNFNDETTIYTILENDIVDATVGAEEGAFVFKTMHQSDNDSIVLSLNSLENLEVLIHNNLEFNNLGIGANPTLQSNSATQTLSLAASLDMTSNKITALLDPTSDQDASTKNYVDTGLGNYLPLVGGTMLGDIDMGVNLLHLGDITIGGFTSDLTIDGADTILYTIASGFGEYDFIMNALGSPTEFFVNAYIADTIHYVEQYFAASNITATEETGNVYWSVYQNGSPVTLLTLGLLGTNEVFIHDNITFNNLDTGDDPILTSDSTTQTLSLTGNLDMGGDIDFDNTHSIHSLAFMEQMQITEPTTPAANMGVTWVEEYNTFSTLFFKDENDLKTNLLNPVGEFHITTEAELEDIFTFTATVFQIPAGTNVVIVVDKTIIGFTRGFEIDTGASLKLLGSIPQITIQYVGITVPFLQTINPMTRLELRDIALFGNTSNQFMDIEGAANSGIIVENVSMGNYADMGDIKNFGGVIFGSGAAFGQYKQGFRFSNCPNVTLDNPIIAAPITIFGDFSTAISIFADTAKTDVSIDNVTAQGWNSTHNLFFFDPNAITDSSFTVTGSKINDGNFYQIPNSDRVIPSVADDGNGFAQVTTTGNHNLVSGQTVTQSGFVTETTYNGTFTVTEIVSSTQYVIDEVFTVTDDGILENSPCNVPSVIDNGGGIAQFNTDLVNVYVVGQAVVHSGFAESTYNGTFIVTSVLSVSYEVGVAYAVDSSGVSNATSLDSTGLFVTASGNPEQANSMTTGNSGLELLGGNEEITINTQDVPEPITSVDGWTYTNLERFEEDTGTPNQGRLTLTELATRRYQVTYSASIQKVGGGGIDIGIVLLKNGVIIGTNPPRGFTTGVNGVTRTEIIQLTTGDIIQVAVINRNGISNIEVFQANLSILLP